MKALFEGVIKGEGGVGMVMVVGFMGLCVPMLVAALALGGALSHDSQVKNRLAKSQYSGIGALEYVRYLSDNPDRFEEWLNDLKDPDKFPEGVDSFTINDTTVEISAAEAGLYNEGFLGFCIFGQTTVLIKEYSEINHCSVGSNGNIEIKEHATIQGSVVSGGNITLKENSYVSGDVIAAGTVTLKEGANYGGTLCQGSHCFQNIGGPTPKYELLIKYIDADNNEKEEYKSVEGKELPMSFDLEACDIAKVIVKAGETRYLEPKCYGNVDVRENATLNLSSGKYAFLEFTIKERSVINLDVSGGPIVFDAVDNLEFKEDIKMHVTPVGFEDKLLVRVQNKARFKENGKYMGTYFGFGADNAEMHVKENSTLRGALYGDIVEIKENTQVYGEPARDAYLAFFSQN